jgi:hypothetical protein
MITLIYSPEITFDTNCVFTGTGDTDIKGVMSLAIDNVLTYCWPNATENGWNVNNIKP